MKWRHETRHFGTRDFSSAKTEVNGFHLTVHRHIGHPPEQWLWSCSRVIQACPLESAKLEDAKQEALQAFHDFLIATLRGIADG